jgi:hypothetical protein
MDLILERSFARALTVGDVVERARSSQWCFELQRVDWRASFLSGDGRRLVCWVCAPDAEAVRSAQWEAALPVDAAWAFSRIGPETASRQT